MFLFDALLAPSNPPLCETSRQCVRVLSRLHERRVLNASFLVHARTRHTGAKDCAAPGVQ